MLAIRCRYINLYGRYYTIGDAVQIIRLLYSVIATDVETNDLRIVRNVISVLCAMLKCVATMMT